MSYVLDTNILLRSVQTSHPTHAEAVRAVGALIARGEQLCITPQNLIEFWAVATRPLESNGLGMTVEMAAREMASLKGLFQLLPDDATIFTEWERLVSKCQVKGKGTHDARLAAAMIAHKVTHLLTFNTDDFKRFSEVTAVSPLQI